MKWMGYGLAAVLVIGALAMVAGGLFDVAGRQSVESTLAELKKKGIPLAAREIRSARPPETTFHTKPVNPTAIKDITNFSATECLLTPETVIPGYGNLPSAILVEETTRLAQRVFFLTEEEEGLVHARITEYKDLIAAFKVMCALPPTPQEEIFRLTGFENAPFQSGAPQYYLRVGWVDALLILDAYAAYRNGQADDALHTVGLILLLQNHVRDLPGMKNQQVAGTITQMVADFLPMLLLKGTFSDEEITSLGEIMERAKGHEAFTRACCEEIVLAKQGFTSEKEAEARFDDKWNRRWSGRVLCKVYMSPALSPLRSRDETIALSLLGRYIEATKLPYYAARKQYEDLQNENEGRFFTTPLISTAFGYAKINQSGQQARNEALLDLAISALALNQYNKKEGAYPESPRELVPDYLTKVPIDVFSGEDLRYARSGEAYALYSVGLNGKTDLKLLDPKYKGEGYVFGRPVVAGDDVVWGCRTG